MARLSIEIAEEQHQQIKALAAMRGLSIKDYILEKALPMTEEEQQAMERLKAFLAPRIAQARRGEFYEGTMDDLLAELNEQHSEQP